MMRFRRPHAASGDVSGQMFRGMAKLAAGNILGRVIALISVPILARIYSPEDYGLLAVYTSLVQILFPLVSLRYVVAVPLPRRDEIALCLFALAGLSILAFGFVASGLLAIAGPWLLGLVSAERLAPWWGLLVIGILTASLAELTGAWATRRRAYKRMAANAVVINALGEGMKIGLGLLGIRPFGLLLGQMTVQSGGAVSFLRAFRDDFRRIPQVVTRARLRFVARYYASYPLMRLPSQFLLVFAMQSPLLYTAGLYGIDVSGQLGMALMTLALPVNMIGQAMGKAYYAEIARIGRNRPGEILALTRKVQVRLFLVGLLPASVLFLLGPQLFALVFGDRWHEAGHYAAILASYTLLQFTSAPLMQLLNVFNRQGMYLVINTCRVALLLALYWAAGHLALTAEAYVRSYGLLMTVFYGIVTAYVFLVVARARTARSQSGGI